MTRQEAAIRHETYVNPVAAVEFPDPFILKYRGEYWGYCTGVWHDGRAFGIMRSRDLIHWEPRAGAMEPLAAAHTCYWAPEVAYWNGRFYLYYSVGNEETMQIRVATALHPEGPFTDQRGLTSEPFAIDAHLYRDESGTAHLFYATDFLSHTHIGTGTVRDRMQDPFTLEGQPRPVTRARYDWQIYDPHRESKGGARWHTIEGPTVLKHKGRYYQMFSGGNWTNTSYGVSYATSDQIDRAGEWDQVADGEHVLPILRTIPGHVIGPGHNSVIRGPDNLQLFCVYHRWADDHSRRQLAIDPIDWAGERMFILGPSIGPVPAPFLPAIQDFFDSGSDGLGAGWICASGSWLSRESTALQHSASEPFAQARRSVPCPYFVAELSLRLQDNRSTNGESAVGIALSGVDGILLQLLIPAVGEARVFSKVQSRTAEQTLPLPQDFNPQAFHHLRVEANDHSVRLILDDGIVEWRGSLAGTVTDFALVTRFSVAEFAGFALTCGWEDLFMDDSTVLARLGWRNANAEKGWVIADHQLMHVDNERASTLVKGPLLPEYELVVNARLDDSANFGLGYGVFPVVTENGANPLFAVELTPSGSVLSWQSGEVIRHFPLPDSFDPIQYQQFRFRKEEGRLRISWENEWLGDVEVPIEASRVGLYATAGVVAFDMVRVTAISTPGES